MPVDVCEQAMLADSRSATRLNCTCAGKLHADQILVSHKKKHDRQNFEAALHRRLQKLFPFADEGGNPAGSVGTLRDLGERLDLLPEGEGAQAG